MKVCLALPETRHCEEPAAAGRSNPDRQPVIASAAKQSRAKTTPSLDLQARLQQRRHHMEPVLILGVHRPTHLRIPAVEFALEGLQLRFG